MRKGSNYISPAISPRILVNISSLYTDPLRVLMEFIDNSFDNAEQLYDKKANSYIRPLEFSIEFSGANFKTARIIISDNCEGMTQSGLLRIIQEIGNSDKKEQPWTNGQFGYGIFSFMAICSELVIISKTAKNHPQKIKLSKQSLETDHASDVKLDRPTLYSGNDFLRESGTTVILSAFDRLQWHDIDELSLKAEIEKHFELMLNRKNLVVKIINSSTGRELNCEPFDYSQFEGDSYDDTVDKLTAPPDHRRTRPQIFKLDDPLKVFIKITKERDIDKKPVIVSKGRRIGEIKDLRSFKSKNKQTIWNHPNLTGYVDVGALVTPTIARTDFRNDSKSKTLFKYLVDIEGLVSDLIDNATRDAVERHYQQLEDALNRALSRLARMDTITLRYRTDIIAGKGIKLEPGTSGRSLVGNLGGKDQKIGKRGKGSGIYGYQWIKEYKKRTPIEHEAKIVQRMFEMVAAGKSCFGIAKTLNQESVPTKSGKKWEARTVSRIVRNPAYVGITYFGQTAGKSHEKTPQESWHVLTDVTPPIISKDLFDRAQAALVRSKELHPGKAQHEYLLTGFVVCADCGSPLVGACLSKRYRYYKCRGTYATASREKVCDARYIKADWLESAVWEKIKGVLADPGVLLAGVRKQVESDQEQANSGALDQEIKELNRRMKKYASQERRIMQAFKIGFTHDVVLDELNQMKKEKERDTARLAALEQTKENIAKYSDYEEKLKELCARIVPDLDNCTNQDKKDAYRYLDLHVKASPEGADIKGYLQPQLSLLTTGQTWA